MASFEGEAKDSEQVHNGSTLIVHRLSLTNSKTLMHVEIESTDTW